MKHTVMALWMLCVGAVLAGCGDGAGTPESERASLRIVFVTHGQAADPFWSVVQNGAQRAGQAMDVQVEYQAPTSFNMVAMARLIDAAVASNPDGLVVSIPDADALDEPIRRAVEEGIPVISINSGGEAAQALGVMTHVGQEEYEAGYVGGEAMAEAGIQHALCLNMEVGNTAQDVRCRGFADAMAEAGAAVDVLAVEMGDPTETQQRIQAALSSQPDVDGLLTLGPSIVLPTLRALRQEGKLGTVKLATFDVSPEILDALEQGTMLFAIDQQQYLQGYLPVVFLSLHVRHASSVASDVVRTGPHLVRAEDVARLQERISR